MNFAELKCKFYIIKIMMKPKHPDDFAANYTYFKSKKDEIIKGVDELDKRCKKVHDSIKVSTLMRSKKQVMNTIRIYIYKFRAQVHFHLKQYGNSLKFID